MLGLPREAVAMNLRLLPDEVSKSYAYKLIFLFCTRYPLECAQLSQTCLFLLQQHRNNTTDKFLDSQYSSCLGSGQLMHQQPPLDEKQQLDLQNPAENQRQDTSVSSSSASKKVSNSRPPLSAVLALFAGVLHLMRRLLLKRRRADAPGTSGSPKKPVSGFATRDMPIEAQDGLPAAILDPSATALFHTTSENDDAPVISTSIIAKEPDPTAFYESQKARLQVHEEFTFWYAPAQSRASKAELRAQAIVWKIREHERDTLFGNTASEAIPGPETLDMGGQFLSNRDRIYHKSALYKISVKMPKGAHLHLHFNAELEPNYLIEKARDNPNMYVRSTQPLLQDADYEVAEIVFNVLPASTEAADVFSDTYKPDWRSPGAKPWMRWSTFRDEYQKRKGRRAEEWIKEKLILSEEEVYGITQTTNG
jgi:hypothetical protein